MAIKDQEQSSLRRALPIAHGRVKSVENGAATGAAAEANSKCWRGWFERPGLEGLLSAEEACDGHAREVVQVFDDALLLVLLVEDADRAVV